MFLSHDGGKLLIQKQNEQIPMAPPAAAPGALAHLVPSAGVSWFYFCPSV